MALVWQALGKHRPTQGYDPAPPLMGYPPASLALSVPVPVPPSLPASGPDDLPAVGGLASGPGALPAVAGPAEGHSAPGALNAAPLGSPDVQVLNLAKLRSFVARHERPTDTPYGPTLGCLLTALVCRSTMLEVSRAELPASPVWRPSRTCRAVEDAVHYDLMGLSPSGSGQTGMCQPVSSLEG